jgi:hypothetical protein
LSKSKKTIKGRKLEKEKKRKLKDAEDVLE